MLVSLACLHSHIHYITDDADLIDMFNPELPITMCLDLDCN